MLAGKDIFQEPLKNYLEQVETLRQYAKTSGQEKVAREQQKIPEKTAEPTEPTLFRRTLLWKCAAVKAPGNLLVVRDAAGPARLMVVEGWNSVAEVGLDGKLIATHKLDLDPTENVSSLRTAVGGDGKRYFVAFLTSHQRCHVYDGQWNLVAHYPADALQHPHSGIADVQLGDLDGDGRLKLYLGYLGVVVRASRIASRPVPLVESLDGKCAVRGPGMDAVGRRTLFCTNNTGAIVMLDAQGERRGELRLPKRPLRLDCRGRSAGRQRAALVRHRRRKARRKHGRRIFDRRPRTLELRPARRHQSPPDHADPCGPHCDGRHGPVVVARHGWFNPHSFGRRQIVGQVQLRRPVVRAGDGRDQRPPGARRGVGPRPGSVGDDRQVKNAATQRGLVRSPPPRTTQQMLEHLQNLLRPHDQECLLAFWDRLDLAQRNSLARQIEAIDFPLIRKLHDGCGRRQDFSAIAAKCQSPPAYRLDVSHDPNPFGPEQANRRAREAIRAGQLGVILVAGGQGTRLGFDHPKGMFPIGPISRKTLFQIHVEKIVAASRRYGVPIPLYLMTSPATHDETVAFFAEHGRFGLPADDLRIFCQGTMPAIDAATGRVLLESPDRIAVSPDGHGGMLAALDRSGALDDIERRAHSASVLFSGGQSAGGCLRAGVHGLPSLVRFRAFEPGGRQARPGGASRRGGPGGRPSDGRRIQRPARRGRAAAQRRRLLDALGRQHRRSCF